MCVCVCGRIKHVSILISLTSPYNFNAKYIRVQYNRHCSNKSLSHRSSTVCFTHTNYNSLVIIFWYARQWVLINKPNVVINSIRTDAKNDWLNLFTGIAWMKIIIWKRSHNSFQSSFVVIITYVCIYLSFSQNEFTSIHTENWIPFQPKVSRTCAPMVSGNTQFVILHSRAAFSFTFIEYKRSNSSVPLVVSLIDFTFYHLFGTALCAMHF